MIGIKLILAVMVIAVTVATLNRSDSDEADIPLYSAPSAADESVSHTRSNDRPEPEQNEQALPSKESLTQTLRLEPAETGFSLPSEEKFARWALKTKRQAHEIAESDEFKAFLEGQWINLGSERSNDRTDNE